MGSNSNSTKEHFKSTGRAVERRTTKKGRKNVAKASRGGGKTGNFLSRAANRLQKKLMGGKK